MATSTVCHFPKFIALSDMLKDTFFSLIYLRLDAVIPFHYKSQSNIPTLACSHLRSPNRDPLVPFDVN